MTVLSRRQFSVVDLAGNVVPFAQVEVRSETIGGMPLASLYSDRAGTVVLGNPFSADANGFAFFHAAAGVYQIRAYLGPSGAPTFEQFWHYIAVGTVDEIDYSTDGTLAANSDALIPTQKAVKTYVDGIVAATDAMVFKGVIDCSANPNYPAADRGWTYRVSVAGKIGGASGMVVEAGDLLLCLTDGTASGTQAGVGASWTIAQTNIDGAVVGPASAVSGHLAIFSGTSGKVIADSGNFTLSGTVSGGGNQINDVVIGTSNPHAGAFAGLTNTVNQNGITAVSNTNTTAGTGSGAVFVAISDTATASFGAGSSTYTGIAALQNRGYVYSGPLANGIALYADGAKDIKFYTNSGVFAGAIDSGQRWALGANVATDSLLTINANAAATLAPSVIGATLLHIVGANSVTPELTMDAFGGGVGPAIVGRMANGTLASKAGIVATNILLSQLAQGWDTTAYATGANIQYRGIEIWGATAHGSEIALRTAAAGATTLTDRVVIQSGMQVGSPTGGDKGAGSINISGAFYANGVAVVGTGTVTSVAGGTGLTGGTITGSGTLAIDPGYGGKKLIATLTASTSAILADTTSLTSAFKFYELEFENLLPATSGVTAQLKVNSGGVQSTSYIGQVTRSNGSSVVTAQSTTALICSGLIAQHNAGPGISGSIRVSNPAGTSAPKNWWGQFTGNTSVPAVDTNAVSGYWNGGNGAITGFQFDFSSGNIASGVIRVYGWN